MTEGDRMDRNSLIYSIIGEPSVAEEYQLVRWPRSARGLALLEEDVLPSTTWAPEPTSRLRWSAI